MSLKQKNKVQKSQKLLNICTIKKNFCVCMYKLVDIGKETYKSNGIKVIVDGIGTLWLNEKQIEEKLGQKNLPVIAKKYDQVYKKRRYELVNRPKK